MVQTMSGDADKRLDPEAARIVARVRRLMVVASLTTLLAVAAVVAVIGYRVFRGEERAPTAPAVPMPLPDGAKVLSSAIGDGRLVLTVDNNGAIELFSFDLRTLRPIGHVRLAPK
jgi:hypothetical protein